MASLGSGPGGSFLASRLPRCRMGGPHRLSSALNVKGWSDQHCGPGADSARLCRFGDPELTRPPPRSVPTPASGRSPRSL